MACEVKKLHFFMLFFFKSSYKLMIQIMCLTLSTFQFSVLSNQSSTLRSNLMYGFNMFKKQLPPQAHVKPKCTECGLLISDSPVSFQGLSYHFTCIHCHKCGVNVRDTSICLKYTTLGGMMTCEGCEKKREDEQ